MSDEKNNSNYSDEIIPIDFDIEDLKQVSQAFFAEAEEILEDIDQLILKLEQHPENEVVINQLFRKIHTVKGAVGAVPGGQLLGSLAHEFEALLSRIKKEKILVGKNVIDLFLHSSKLLKLMADSLRSSRDVYPEELSAVIETISKYSQINLVEDGAHSSAELQKSEFLNLEEKVSVDDSLEGVWLSRAQLHEMSKIAGELLVLKNLKSSFNELQDKRWQDFSLGINRISDSLQKYVLEIRKEPVKESFRSLPVLVRQTSSELNKEVDLHMSGLDLLIDKALGNDLYHALIHIVRNSIDHGVEDVFDRTTAGKNPRGQLTLEIAEHSGKIFTSFSDDGRGLDLQKIKETAYRKGLLSDDSDTLSEQDIYKLIFHPGFSTKEKVTTMSGRGVGMDVVQATVEKYLGEILVESRPGEGTKFTLVTAIPQNILVESTLICSYQNFALAVPLQNIGEISSCAGLHFSEVDDLRWAQINGKTVPVMTYSEYSQRKIFYSPEQVQRMSVVVLKIKEQSIGILVEKIERQTDLVIKSLSSILGEMPGFKGTSVLVDERVAYIIDPENFYEMLSNLESKRGQVA